MTVDIRAMIREVLREELSARGLARPQSAPQIREEGVTLASDADLAAFVRRILTLANDSRARADVENGRHIFRLAAATTGTQAAVEAYERPQPRPSLAPVSFERGLVNEREIRNLPEGTVAVRVGKTVRLTPLAQDELRRRGIKIERATS